MFLFGLKGAPQYNKRPCFIFRSLGFRGAGFSLWQNIMISPFLTIFIENLYFSFDFGAFHIGLLLFR